ncbi:hypothetical protein L195_g051675 [Trifolium pratense]|uniref:Uncharacterized protein n=1 Tax=Trifolium pratense TaxID=57577 RepID=A0A2K3K107_TRIPR|nr:hypothetical protein L195_g051675 [Trifolium pratense]
MPRRVAKPTMGERIDALETQMGNVTTTLDELARQMQDHARQMQQQSLLLSQLSKQIGHKGVTTEGETSVGESSQYESRLAGNKVKLPLFDDDDLSWEKLKKSLINLVETDRVEDYVEAFELLSSQMQMMRIAKDVDKELNEEDEDGDRSYRRKQGLDRLGRNDWAGPTGKNTKITN